MLLARGGRSLTLGWVGLHISKMLKLAEDAPTKCMSTSNRYPRGKIAAHCDDCCVTRGQYHVQVVHS